MYPSADRRHVHLRRQRVERPEVREIGGVGGDLGTRGAQLRGQLIEGIGVARHQHQLGAKRADARAAALAERIAKTGRLAGC